MNMSDERKKIIRNRQILSGFFLIFMAIVISGIVGLYSLSMSRSNGLDYITAIDQARSAESLLIKQFNIWKTLVIELTEPDGSTGEKYRSHMHEFSKISSIEQDMLFGIKVMMIKYPDVGRRIVTVINEHRELTRQYMGILVKLENGGALHREDLIRKAASRDENVISELNDIVNSIKEISEKEYYRINRYYSSIVLWSFIAISIVSGNMSIFLFRRIIRGRQILEKRVKERTRELDLTVEQLKKEVHERINAEQRLRDEIEKTEDAKKLISISEERYRMLVENTSDVIFTMDQSFNILKGNKAILQTFHINPDNTSGTNFLDLIYTDSNGRANSRLFIREKLDVFLQEKKPLVFRTEFISPVNREPRELEVTLEFIASGNLNEILCKLTRLKDEEIVRNLHSEKQKFIIGNYLLTADEITHNVTIKLLRFMPVIDVNLVRIAIREIIINAIEHGNLDIRYEEKTEVLLSDSYFEFVANRRSDPRYNKRKVTIEYYLSQDKVMYRITDEGNGFDYRKMFSLDPLQLNLDNEQHGRGISMARQIFDRVDYNERGNSVLLVKHFSMTQPAA